MRPHPHLYQINAWPWLDALSRRSGRLATLATVPDGEWDRIRDLGIDIVYLMGVWKRSALSRQIARADPTVFRDFDRALPDWQARDVVGSAFSVTGYDPDKRIGTWEDVDDVRAKLRARRMRLIVDFIPNHTAFDHPWVSRNTDRYVQGDEALFRGDPSACRAVETASGEIRILACGRDPYFPPWTDVAQLDYSNPDTRTAMLAELKRLALHVDGVRCDMAMLVLSSVFGETWKGRLRSAMPPTEFWTDARQALPGFLMLAEVYWDLDWQLQQIGFDFTYDKRLYDRLLHGIPADVRGHLHAEVEYQRKSARFIENHDEAPSAAEFGDRLRAAAVVMSSVPGLRFFHHGQFEGRRVRVPVQLGRWPDEAGDEAVERFYGRLLPAVDADVFHEGEWRLLDVDAAGDGSSVDLIAWSWALGHELRIVVVNLGHATAQGYVRMGSDMPDRGDPCLFEDLLDDRRYSHERATLNETGLFVRLERGAGHVLRLVA